MSTRHGRGGRGAGLGLACGLGLSALAWSGVAAPALAESASRLPANPTIGAVPSARIDWGIWLSPDGCEYWIADGYDEGYLVDRVDPRTGLPVCHTPRLCLSEPADALFPPGRATLDPAAAARLGAFFAQGDSYAYAIHVHADGDAGSVRALALTRRQAAAVAQVARSAGAVVGGQVGHGAAEPVASNATPAGQAQNRRVDIVCYEG